MNTNTMVFIVVAALAPLVLAGVLILVAYKTHTQERPGNGQMVRDHAEEDAPARPCHPQHHGTAYRSEAVTSRDQLNERRVHRLAG
jgi:hypothetical protein